MLKKTSQEQTYNLLNCTVKALKDRAYGKIIMKTEMTQQYLGKLSEPTPQSQAMKSRLSQTVTRSGLNMKNQANTKSY